MQTSFKRILTGASFFLITIVVAVIGYMLFGWTLLESIYMVVITIFGVGYGEVKPLDTPTQRIFTILVIIAGTSSAVYTVGGFVQMVTEGEINRALSEQRKQKSIENLDNHVIICGFGRMGYILAQQMQEIHQPFVIVDYHTDGVNQAESLGYLAYQGDATEESILQAVGITRAKVLAIALPDDAASVFITLTSRELNPRLMILARGERATTEKKLRLAGADHVILPATLSALRMANIIARPTALDFLGRREELNYLNELLAQIDVQMDELGISRDSPLVGKTIRELEVRSKGAFIIVALCRSEGTVIVRPSPSLVLNYGDTLILLGHQGNIRQFAHNYELQRRKILSQGLVQK